MWAALIDGSGEAWFADLLAISADFSPIPTNEPDLAQLQVSAGSTRGISRSKPTA